MSCDAIFIDFILKIYILETALENAISIGVKIKFSRSGKFEP